MKKSPKKVTDSQFNDILNQLSEMTDEIDQINANPLLLNQGTPDLPVQNVPQAMNQLRNASFSHSVNSWFNTSTANNKRYECYPWYSHPDIANQAMFLNTTISNATKTFTNTDVNTGTNVITVTGHGWQTGTGIAFTSSDPPLPLVTATVYFVISVTANTIKLATTYANALLGTAIDITTAGGAVTDTLSYNYALKSDLHTMFAPEFSIWDLDNTYPGTAAINQGFTLDAPITGEEAMATAGYTLYGVINCARINQYIYAPAAARLGCGLYADQSAVWDYISAAYTVDTDVRPPVATPTSREYMVHITTDRGFTVNTSVTTEANAPSDTDFTNGAGVVLNWQRALNYGVLAYEIYRKTGASYKLLFRITNGTTSYIDNNSYLPDVVAAYPSADFTGRFTYTATIPNVLTSLAIDGISPTWDSIPFALLVPSNYNLANTNLTEKQWVRWDISGLNGPASVPRFDIRVTDAVMDGTREIMTSASGQFTAAMVGQDIVLTGDGLTWGGAIDVYNSPTSIDLDSAVDTIPSVSVQFAGYGSINGNYIYKGTSGGKNYYNLLGTASSTTLNVIKWASAEWGIYDSAGSIQYSSSDAVDYPWEVTTWTINSSGRASLPLPTVSQYIIPSTVIEAGAPLNSVVFDLAQLSYGANAIFSFNPQDYDGTHGIPPVTPNGSNQGGVGPTSGGGGDGGPVCVATDEIVQMVRGIGRHSVKAIEVTRGDVLIDSKGQLNHVLWVKYGVTTVWQVETENGVTGRTSDTHKYFQNQDDKFALMVQGFKEGDEILTNIDGVEEVSKIKTITRIGDESVVSFGLAPGFGFLVGTGGYEKWGGIASHNNKIHDPGLLT